VVVETDFADRDHARIRSQFGELGEPLIIESRRVVRMDAHDREDVRATRRERDRVPSRTEIGAHADHDERVYARRPGALNHRVRPLRAVGGVKMAVGVDEH
jgi:hypothetical protein